LRTGFTTGACAAVAVKGALLALIHQRPTTKVQLRLPNADEPTFLLRTCSYTTAEATGSVIKDAGDDPDVTHGAEICARVRWTETPGITFQRGVGVGLVTKPGLPVPPGEPAINPAPRRLIADTVADVFQDAGLAPRGLQVEISVPNGEELARKTFNPRLGIVGGISILGTTGIVVPYSTAAWLASVMQNIDVAVAQGRKQLVLTVGARGERFARKLFPLPEDAFIQIGPFFGDALRHCAERGVEHVILAAMLGKLAKFAAGNESVHSTNSSQDFVFLAEIARTAGAESDLLAQIGRANTAQEVGEMVRTAGLTACYSILCERAWRFARSVTGTNLVLDVYLTNQDGQILGRSGETFDAGCRD
jgi:cobalt-precorrin-5B (C1)-methyltransferase